MSTPKHETPKHETPKHEIQKQETVSIPATHMISESGGLEILDKNDFQIPRIKLLQAMSKEVSDGLGEAGEWINTTSYQTLGDTLIFTPITLWKSRVLFSEDRDEGYICRSANAQESVDGHLCEEDCPFNANEWVDRKPPKCTVSYNYLVLPNNDSMPAIVSLSKSSFSAGRALNTLLIAAAAEPWAWKYELKSTKRTNKFGTFYVATVRKQFADGAAVETTEDEKSISISFFKLWADKKIQDGGLPF